jgi:hypothetical protein
MGIGMDGFMEHPLSDPDDWVVGLVRETLDVNSIETPTRQDVARLLFEAWDFIEETFQEFNTKFDGAAIPLKPIDAYVELVWNELSDTRMLED